MWINATEEERREDGRRMAREQSDDLSGTMCSELRKLGSIRTCAADKSWLLPHVEVDSE